MNIVEHDTLLVKLEHYGIGVCANIWLESYLSHRKHHVLTNITTVTFGVPQGLVIDPLQFLTYTNDLGNLHFADDTNLLHFSESVTKLNKYVKLDLKNLVNWLKCQQYFSECGKNGENDFQKIKEKIDSQGLFYRVRTCM